MEPTIIELSEVTVKRSRYGKPLIRISQDNDLVIIDDADVEKFVAAVREQARPIEEPEPTPEKWYVVLKNSNCRLTNAPGEPIIFTDYDLAKRYGVQHGRRSDRWFLPMSVDDYERVFGR